MQNIFENLANRQKQTQTTVEHELDQLLTNQPDEEQLATLKRNYISRVTELESNVRSLKSHLNWQSNARPQLISLTNFVAGLSIGAVFVYVALTSSFLNHNLNF